MSNTRTNSAPTQKKKGVAKASEQPKSGSKTTPKAKSEQNVLANTSAKSMSKPQTSAGLAEKKRAVSLDEIDIRLLNLLQDDASKTTKELALALELSITPVHERIKRLERVGLIKKQVVLLNRVLAKKSLVVYCYLTLKEHSKTVIAKFDKDIFKLDEVMECYNIAGQFDYVLKVVVEDMEEYQNFMVKLSNVENIVNVQTSFVLREIKHTTALPLTLESFSK